MNKKAFPGTYENLGGVMCHSQGMDLRDYFAAKAMQGVINRDTKIYTDDYLMIISKISYDIADAMIEQRNNK